MTVLVWAVYNSLALTDLDPLHPQYSYAVGAYETLISGGSVSAGNAGSWQLGRYNQLINRNETRVLIHTNEVTFTPTWGSYGDPVYGNGGKVIFNLGDTGSDNSLGKTTNWAHYGFTFNNGVAKSYYNGRFLGTNDMSAVVTALKLGTGQRAYDSVGFGANPHAGTPEFDDESPNTSYPNQGFLNGAMDEPMIWLRALTLQEIGEIFVAQGGDPALVGSEGGGEPEPPTQGASARAKLRGIRVR